MTDTAKSWIEERRAIIHGAREAIRPAEAIDLGLIDLPRALDALNAVLELHRATPVYEVAEMCENDDEDHQDSRHWEAEDGTLLCEDLPTGDTNCRWCCDEYGDPIEWPCFTVKAIQQALGGETND